MVREILHAQTLKIRAEVLSLYIRTAKVQYKRHRHNLMQHIVLGNQDFKVLFFPPPFEEIV